MALGRLNIGCGFAKKPGWLNADYMPNCHPDIVFDANAPWPFPDESFFEIYASHVFEHIPNWWGAFLEASRVLKPGGILEIRVPDESASMAGTYRDHLTIFTMHSFHGVQGYGSATNAWAKTEQDSIPLGMIHYEQVPFATYKWVPQIMLRFCAKHLRNFIHEQRFIFRKIGFIDRVRS